MALITAFHEVYGSQRIPESRLRMHPDEWSTYNPAEHTVEEVVDYLAEVSPRERARVLELERRGKKRKTVLELDEPEDEGQADEPPAFDPSEHSRDDVVAYLSIADATERARVLELERSGRKRSTVLALAEDPQSPDAAGAGTTTTAGDDPGTSTED